MQVTVNAVGFDKGPVEVRWNALDGPSLGTATGPDFSVATTIPSASDGLYSLVIISRAPDGSFGSVGTAAFEVVSGAGTANPAVSGKAARPSSGNPDSANELPLVPALLGGAGLLTLGGILGAVVARRRPIGEAVQTQSDQ